MTCLTSSRIYLSFQGKNANKKQKNLPTSSSWWFQPLWKYICQIGHLPQIKVKINNISNHHPVFDWRLFSSKKLGSPRKFPPNKNQWKLSNHPPSTIQISGKLALKRNKDVSEVSLQGDGTLFLTSKMQASKATSSTMHRFIALLLSIESWLFNRDPKTMVYDDPDITRYSSISSLVGGFNPIENMLLDHFKTKQPGALSKNSNVVFTSPPKNTESPHKRAVF